MKQMLLIGIGGFFGSISRYGVYIWAQKWINTFPMGTLMVNLSGSLIIGLIAGSMVKPEQPFYWWAVIGFCGGFTTFSTFALDGIKLIRNDQWASFILYSSGSVVGGLILCILGIWLGDKLS